MNIQSVRRSINDIVNETNVSDRARRATDAIRAIDTLLEQERLEQEGKLAEQAKKHQEVLDKLNDEPEKTIFPVDKNAEVTFFEDPYITHLKEEIQYLRGLVSSAMERNR